MDPLKEKEYEDARRKEVDDAVEKELDRIRKKHHNLTEDDKAYLRARQGYLTRGDMEEYKAELAVPVEGELTRKELEANAREAGLTDEEIKKATNKDALQAAIDAVIA